MVSLWPVVLVLVLCAPPVAAAGSSPKDRTSRANKSSSTKKKTTGKLNVTSHANLGVNDRKQQKSSTNNGSSSSATNENVGSFCSPADPPKLASGFWFALFAGFSKIADRRSKHKTIL